MNIICLLKGHNWKFGPSSFEGRKSEKKFNPISNSYTVTIGPEETFYTNSEGPYYLYKDCLRCKTRKVYFHNRWV